MSSSVTVIRSLDALRSLNPASDQISMIDFHAVWCGPCKVISPVFQKLAVTYAGRIKFYKVDVDDAKDVAAYFQVTAMPTFVVLKGQNKVDEMKGAEPAGLEALARKHAPPAGSGSTASGSGAPPEKGLEGFSPLNTLLDASQVSCLNEDAEHTVRHLLKGGGDKWLNSDSDEQLLLHLPMNQAVRVRAIRFSTLPSVYAQAPKTIRIFVNSPSLGFSEAESQEPTQEVVLSEAQARGEEAVQLRFVRFQSVSSLAIFVVDNQGGEEVTRIDSLELLGVAVDGTDMTQLRKGEDDHEH